MSTCVNHYKLKAIVMYIEGKEVRSNKNTRKTCIACIMDQTQCEINKEVFIEPRSSTGSPHNTACMMECHCIGHSGEERWGVMERGSDERGSDGERE